MKRVYLDYAASTPVDKEVLREMMPYFSEKFGNPGSINWFGQQASAAIYAARDKLAKAIGTDYQQIIFTGSATEANNLAIKGLIRRSDNHCLVSAIEHQSVMNTAEELVADGLVKLDIIPVDVDGIVQTKKIISLLNKKTALVSVMMANSEIGTIQPVKEIGQIIKGYREKNKSEFPLFHCDAVQAFGFQEINVHDLGVDMLTLSAHKIYGPKGMGALYVKNKSWLKPLIGGGNREYGLRAGTENTPYIVGFGKAVDLAEKRRARDFKKIKELRDYFWRELKKIVPGCEINGSMTDRLPNNLSVYFPGRPAQDLLIELDLAGISGSTGSACTSRATTPSYVIDALGFGGDRAYSSMRFTLGRITTKSDINFALKVFKKRFGA